MQTNSGRRGENGPMQRVTERERRPGKTVLTCVNDFADACWGQRRATFIVITEAALCWSHLKCIFLPFFTQELHVFGCMCSPNVYRHTNPHASILT